MARIYNPASLYIAPTLVIGVGGTGVETMRLIKSRVRQSLDPVPGVIEFMAMDTEPCPNLPGQEHIFEREFVELGGYNASSLLQHIDKHPHIRDWWFNERDLVSGSIHKGARQKRYVGRLSLYFNWSRFVQRLDPKARAIREIVEKEKLQRRGPEVERNTGHAQVYIISSVCGGTGSGVLLDTAFRVRQVFGDDADIVGLLLLPSCFLPELQSRIQQQRIQANAYATLLEINHFMSGAPFEGCFPDHAFSDGDDHKFIDRLQRPFDSIYLVDRSNGKEFLHSIDGIRRMVAQHVYLDMVSPLGKEFASRRANLRDLAGESAQTGAGAKKQPLIVSGFVTASLVLPADKVDVSARNGYVRDFMLRRIVGSPLSSATERDFVQRNDARFRQLDALLHFEKVDATAVAQPQKLKDILLGQTATSSATTIDLSSVQPVIQAALEDLRQNLNGDFKHHGLHGVDRTLHLMLGHIQQRLAALNSETETLGAELAAKRQALQNEPHESKLQHVVDGIFGLVASGNTPGQKRRTEWQQRQAQLQSEIRSVQLRVDRNEQAKQAFTRLQAALQEIGRDVQHRIQLLDAHARDLGNSAAQHGKAIPTGAVILHGLDLFELATEVGDEPYTVVVDGAVSKQSFLESRPMTLLGSSPLGKQVEEDMLDKVINAGLFCLRVESVDDRSDLVLDQSPSVFVVQQWIGDELNDQKLQTAAHNGANGNGNVPSTAQNRIIDYLDWFYTSVRHNNGPSRNSTIDPVLMLRHRCAAPFLEVDEAAIGAAGAANTEDVRILGVDIERTQDMVGQEVLRDLEMFKDVATGIGERLDVSFSRHGYSMSALKDLKQYRDAYKYFTNSLKEKIHIHRTWPAIELDDGSKAQMDDIMP